MKTEERLGRIETRLDSIDDNLARHMKRSDAIEAQIHPMLELRTEIKGVIKFFKFLGVIAGVIECIRLLVP